MGVIIVTWDYILFLYHLWRLNMAWPKHFRITTEALVTNVSEIPLMVPAVLLQPHPFERKKKSASCVFNGVKLMRAWTRPVKVS